MAGLDLDGRIGIEAVQDVRGCCVDSILAWRPRIVGAKHKCLYCDNPFKAIRAAELSDDRWTGMLNETRYQKSVPDFELGSLWFSRKRFANSSKVKEWCIERGLQVDSIDASDNMAVRVDVQRLLPGSERIVWAAPGVLSVVGVTKMDTADMAAGGALHPFQGLTNQEEEETTTTSESETEAASGNLPPRLLQGRRGMGPGGGRMDGSGLGQGGRGECLVGKCLEDFEKALDDLLA